MHAYMFFVLFYWLFVLTKRDLNVRLQWPGEDPVSHRNDTYTLHSVYMSVGFLISSLYSTRQTGWEPVGDIAIRL